MNNVLGVENKVYKCCDYSKTKEAEHIIIPKNIYSEWLFAMNFLPKEEWIATFKVEDNKVISYNIRAIGSSALVEFEDNKNCNGVVHSHHSMGAFHSGQDDSQCRNLYTYSIVIAFDNVIATKKVKLPCGGFGYIDCNIEVEGFDDLANTIDTLKKEYEAKSIVKYVQPNIYNPYFTQQVLPVDYKTSKFEEITDTDIGCPYCYGELDEVTEGNYCCRDCNRTVEKKDVYIWRENII